EAAAQLANSGATGEKAPQPSGEGVHCSLPPPAHVGGQSLALEVRVCVGFLWLEVLSNLAEWSRKALVRVKREHPHLDLFDRQTADELAPDLGLAIGDALFVVRAIAVAIDNQEEEVDHRVVFDDRGEGVTIEGIV